MTEADSQQDRLLQQQLAEITKPQKNNQKWGDMQSAPSVFSNYHQSSLVSDKYTDHNRHRFNHYADKQLCHLVLVEEFDFAKIAELLSYAFREERIRFTQTNCRQRWTELYSLSYSSSEVKEKRMEDKRATSVSTFTDPYTLYNLDELLQKLEKEEKCHGSVDELEKGRIQSGSYNIFKNSFRQIDDIEGFKMREQHMQVALALAQDPSHIVTDKLMHFSPYYERLNDFEVIQEELTEEKMREIMSMPIQMENLQHQLRAKDMNEAAQKEWKAKRSKKQQNEQRSNKYDIEQNWDEYESD